MGDTSQITDELAAMLVAARDLFGVSIAVTLVNPGGLNTATMRREAVAARFDVVGQVLARAQGDAGTGTGEETVSVVFVTADLPRVLRAGDIMELPMKSGVTDWNQRVEIDTVDCKCEGGRKTVASGSYQRRAAVSL